MTSENIRYTHVYNTICYACGTGCGIRVSEHRNGSLLLEGDPDHPINKGKLCVKGSDIKYSINDESFRLRNPMVRFSKNMPLKTASWDKTIERVVAVMKTFIEKFGSESVAFYVSEELLNEEYFLIQKFVRTNLGSAHLYSRNLWISKVNYSIQHSYGRAFTFASYSDLDLADYLFITSNIADSHPILWNRIVALKTSKPEVKIIYIGAIRDEISMVSDMHIKAFPGTESQLYLAIGQRLIESGKTNKNFEINNPDLFAEYVKNGSTISIVNTAEICGIKISDIEKVSSWIGKSKNFISLWTEGDEIYNSTSNEASFASLINLHFLTGKINKAGSGPILLKQASNARGNWEIEKCFAKPLSELTNRHNHTGKKGCKSAEVLLSNIKSGKVKFLWVIGADIFSEFQYQPTILEGLKNARFVVYQGTDENSHILKYADAVLPSAHRIEKEGTIFNASGGLSYSPKVKAPISDSLTDGEIISSFARSMGFSEFEYKSNEEIFFELSKSLKIISPSQITYSILKKHKVIYPAYLTESSEEELPMTAIKEVTQEIEDDDFTRKDNNFPWYLEVSIFETEGSSPHTVHAKSLKNHNKNTYLLVNPSDAKVLQVGNNDLVEISSSLGSVRVKAIISDGIRKGTVFAYLNLEGTSKDDISDWQSLLWSNSNPTKRSAIHKIQLKKYIKEKQKIVIIGAGAAAYGFVKAYRKINEIDEIEIFSKEKTTFYDRFKLPEYLSGAHLWDQLLKMDKAEEASLNISIHRGMSILKIDRESKCIIDAENNKTAYDILIIATGSRAAKPKNTPKKSGIFTMRSRHDAENFRNNVPQNAEVVIVGGGILGLEVASSLREKGAKVTIIQRTSRFLDRQLDALGSQILHEEMIDLGCDIYYNDEVQLYYGQTTITGVGLKSGRRVPCQAMVIAIGNIPNIHLAKECGLESKLGILVNTQLQTKDPSILAIGEVAEINGMLYNFPLAAEEQAVVAANFINGDRNSFYQGSLLRNTIKLQGREICSTGLVEAPDDKDYEEIIILDKKKRYYKKCIIYGDRLVGIILIGDKTEFEAFGELIANKVLLKDSRTSLLRC